MESVQKYPGKIDTLVNISKQNKTKKRTRSEEPDNVSSNVVERKYSKMKSK